MIKKLYSQLQVLILGKKREKDGCFEAGYNYKTPAVFYRIHTKKKQYDFSFTPDNLKEFPYALKVYFWLCKSRHLVNTEFVCEKIESL